MFTIITSQGHNLFWVFWNFPPSWARVTDIALHQLLQNLISVPQSSLLPPQPLHLTPSTTLEEPIFLNHTIQLFLTSSFRTVSWYIQKF